MSKADAKARGLSITVTGTLFYWKQPGQADEICLYAWANPGSGDQYIIAGPRPKTPPNYTKDYRFEFIVPDSQQYQLTDEGSRSIGQGSFGVLRPLSPVSQSRSLADTPSDQISPLVVKSGSYSTREEKSLVCEVGFFTRVYLGTGHITFDKDTSIYHSVLPRVEGIQIFKYLRDEKGVSDSAKLRIIIAAAKSLKSLHEEYHFIHGDATICNFNLVMDEGKYIAYPLDFGCSYELNEKARVCETNYLGWHPDRRNVSKKASSDEIPNADPCHDVYSLAYSFMNHGGCTFSCLGDVIARNHSVDEFIQIVEAKLQDLNSTAQGYKALRRSKGCVSQALAKDSAAVDINQLPSSSPAVLPASSQSAVPGLTECPKQKAAGRSWGWVALPILLGVGATSVLLLAGLASVASVAGWIPLALGLIVAAVATYKGNTPSVSGLMGFFGVASDSSDAQPYNRQHALA